MRAASQHAWNGEFLFTNAPAGLTPGCELAAAAAAAGHHAGRTAAGIRAYVELLWLSEAEFRPTTQRSGRPWSYPLHAARSRGRCHRLHIAWSRWAGLEAECCYGEGVACYLDLGMFTCPVYQGQGTYYAPWEKSTYWHEYDLLKKRLP